MKVPTIRNADDMLVGEWYLCSQAGSSGV